ncbi:MAG: hypothetical protein E6G92_01575 [Alphaproteobacteria bacterium]|nr:MAG: hypothetical protein E6G92_01575 [Alphaproteobacteria bacterium]
MEIVLAYLGPVLVFIGALLGLTLGKDGKWTFPKGWGRAFLITAILGFALATYQASRALNKAAVARAEAEAARNRETAGQRTMLGGFDFDRPFQTGSFYFDVPSNELGEAVSVPGFAGPFPALDAGASGLLTINVPNAFFFEYTLRLGPGGLQLVDGGGQYPTYVMRAAPGGAEFVPAGTPASHRESSRHGGDDGDLRTGQWRADADGAELSYHLGIASREPLRKVVSGLANAPRYGRLTFTVPGMPEARRQQIAAAYRQIRPFFVFYAPLAAGNPNADTCVTRIRVPMEMRRVPTAGPDELAFDLAAAAAGFDTETCLTAYVP